jgi:hypothetical protein
MEWQKYGCGNKKKDAGCLFLRLSIGMEGINFLRFGCASAWLDK